MTVQQRSHVSPSAFVITIAACSSLIACSGASAKDPATSKSETMNNCCRFSWMVSSNAFVSSLTYRVTLAVNDLPITFSLRASSNAFNTSSRKIHKLRPFF